MPLSHSALALYGALQPNAAQPTKRVQALLIIPKEAWISPLEVWLVETIRVNYERGIVLSLNTIRDAAARVPIPVAAEKLTSSEFLADLDLWLPQAVSLSDEDFAHACHEVVAQFGDRQFDWHVQNAYSMFRSKGRIEATAYLVDNLMRLGSGSSSRVTNLWQSLRNYDQLSKDIKAYASRANLTGIASLDNHFGGGLPGELHVWGAYTGDGKSTFLWNNLYHINIVQGKNVAVGSIEMTLEQCRARILARHSCHPKFGNPQGIPTKKIIRDDLTEHERKFLRDKVIADLTETKTYGELFYFDLPYDVSGREFQAEISRMSLNEPLAAIGVDYIELMGMGGRFQNKTAEISELVKFLKRLARTYESGYGTQVIALTQTTKDKWEEAMKHGRYTLGSYSLSSESQKTADFCGWLLRTSELAETNEIKAGVLKYRSDDIMPVQEFFMFADFTTALMSSTRHSTPAGQVRAVNLLNEDF